jgi:glucose-6-phosphate 1-dehydrogenase
MTDDQSTQKKPDSCSFVIFGVTGDLAHRLVIPALYNLAATDLLPDKFCIVGIARKAMSNDELRDSLMQGLREFATRPVDDAIARRLLECVTCVAADPKDAASFDRMREQLEKLEAARKTGGNRLFYLATPPDAFAPIARELGRTGLLREENGAWRRLVVEKPFGTDLDSAKTLNGELLKIVDEHQIYRIDHYLGKETVQNILVLRFANGMFEPIWNRNHIDHVQITVDEKLGVGHRGSFYDATGALRDMVPNHLFQLHWSRWSRRSVSMRIRCARRKLTCWRRSRPRASRRRCTIRCAASIKAARSATPKSRTIERPKMSSRTAPPKPTPH